MAARRELDEGRTVNRANPKTIQDKVLVGYQGWFTCAGDGEPVGPGHHGWLHWFNAPIPSGGRPNTDLWPDVSEYSPSELYPAPGLKTADGAQVFLFSSRHPKTVRRHFHWMALHGVDGAFLQRFAGQCDIEAGNQRIRNIRDEVGVRVKEAAEAEGRVFAIMYDVSGVSPDRIQRILERDWIHLLRDQCLLDSPNYLREKGSPVVALWGFGFNGRNHTPDLVRSIVAFFRSSTPGGVYLVAGTPGHWRTSNSDADRNPQFVQAWTDCFDAISPWTVGRYGNEEAADRWGEDRVKADAEYLKKLEESGRTIDYIPVVFPGGSGYNLSGGKWGMNDIQRNGGRFLWKQIHNARRAGVRTIYGAMWDEYDEGTAFMPVVSSSSQLPVHPSYSFLALDADRYELPSDWYMRIVGFAAEALHGERTLLDTFPFKELQDYWGTRPRYEEIDDEEQRKIDDVTRAFRAWEVSEGNTLDDAPPPPYCLEDTPAQDRPDEQWLQQQSQTPAAQVPLVPSSGDVRNVRQPAPQVPRPPPTDLAGHSYLAASSRAAVPPPSGAHWISAGSAGSSASALPRHPQVALAPPVDMSSHPQRSITPSTRTHRPPGEIVMAPPTSSHPAPHTSSSVTHLAHDVGRKHTHGHAHLPEPTMHHAYHQSHAPNPAIAIPSALGHLTPVEVGAHMRGRQSSRERRRRSSSSGSGKKKSHSPPRRHSHRPDVHRHPSYVSQANSHVSPTSPRPPPSPHPLPFPDAGVYHAHPEGGQGWVGSGTVRHGPYAPGHPPLPAGSSYAHPHQQQGAYAAHYQNQMSMPVGGPHSAYAPYGAGHGPGYGYDPSSPPSHAYPHSDSHACSPHSPPPMMTPQPAPSIPPRPPVHPRTSIMSSSYYPSYPSGAPPFAGDGRAAGGGGVLTTGLASALHAVEGIAGKDRRRQLEEKVKSLTQTGSGLLNKLK